MKQRTLSIDIIIDQPISSAEIIIVRLSDHHFCITAARAALLPDAMRMLIDPAGARYEPNCLRYSLDPLDPEQESLAHGCQTKNA